MEWRKENYRISTDNTQLQLEFIHQELNKTYWAEGIDVETLNIAIANSLNFGLYANERQIGFARFITDYATFAYMADVFVLNEFRGQGLGKWLVQCMLAYPGTERYRKLLLATTTAAGLYEKFGFEQSKNPSLYWQIHRPDVYKT
ncbi:MAG: GNAT family N-acetyltransferase [Glaciimonas sp.]|nr:GNAT family N-acetyltransferase [Glaciimonas sp.]